MSKNTPKPGEDPEEETSPTADLKQEPPVPLQDEKEVDQDNPQPSSSTSTEAKPKKMHPTHFDRLVPRYSGDTERPKRKAAMMTESSETSDKVAAKKSGAKKEYSKLRTLVPALTEREDISKVEIIEETIRYIDALHHQLASRATNEQPVDNEDHNDQSSTANAGGESTLENPSSSSPSSPVSPLKTLTSETGRRRQGGAAGTSSSSSTSSSDRSSSHDVKAAVENIQSMFAAYLEHQRSSSSSDESNS